LLSSTLNHLRDHTNQLACAFVLASLPAAAAGGKNPVPKPDPEQACIGEAIIDAQTHTLISGRNPDAALIPASTSKLNTLILSQRAIKAKLIKPDELISFYKLKPGIKETGKDQCGPLEAGKNTELRTLTPVQMQSAMMVISDNKAALAMQKLLEQRTERKFSDLSSDLAAEFKMTGPYIMVEGAGVSGISDCNKFGKAGPHQTALKLTTMPVTELPKLNMNITTPHNLAILAAEAAKIPELRKIMQQTTFDGYGKVLVKPNKLLRDNADSAAGKTGYTDPAGDTMAVEKDGYGVSVMHCDATKIASPTEKKPGILQSLRNFRIRDIFNGFGTRFKKPETQMAPTTTINTAAFASSSPAAPAASATYSYEPDVP
jgi:hypothetical protein